MTRRAAQLNIRSDKARQRVADLVHQTGKTATQVVEEALQAYRPPPPVERQPLPKGFEYRNGWIVQTAKLDHITPDQHMNAVALAREDRDRLLLGLDDA
jgi:hypothetical protein